MNGSYYFLVDDYFKVSAVFCRIKAPFLGNSFFVQSQRKFFFFFFFIFYDKLYHAAKLRVSPIIRH